jgi:hypothetical protein
MLNIFRRDLFVNEIYPNMSVHIIQQQQQQQQQQQLQQQLQQQQQ